MTLNDCLILSNIGIGIGFNSVDEEKCCIVNSDTLNCDENGRITNINWNGYGLEGTFDNAIFNLTKLQVLDWSSNRLQGSLTRIGESLQYLYLGDNYLTGPIPNIPDGLQVLSLFENRMNGSLPTLPDSLYGVDISYNNFVGRLPDKWSANLSFVDVGNCNFIGELPEFPYNMTIFYADHNLLNGTLPKFNPNLLSLNIEFNKFNTTVPELPQYMEIFLASSSGIHGTLSTIPDSMSILDLSDNQIFGNIQINEPEIVYLQWNLLTGISIKNTDSMSRCDISGNPVFYDQIKTIAPFCRINGILYRDVPNPSSDNSGFQIYYFALFFGGAAIIVILLILGFKIKDYYTKRQEMRQGDMSRSSIGLKSFSRTNSILPFRPNPFSKSDRRKSQLLLSNLA